MIPLHRLSNDIRVESHKSLISEYDVKRFTLLQMQKQRLTVRYSTMKPSGSFMHIALYRCSRSNVMFVAPVKVHIPLVDPTDPYRMIGDVVDVVCAEINSKTVNEQTDDKFR